jgi:hypothetical protein
MAQNQTTDKPVGQEIGDTPAFYVDAFIVSINGDRIRLTFGEHIEGKTYYRTAVCIPISDAQALSKDIPELIERYQKVGAKE